MKKFLILSLLAFLLVGTSSCKHSKPDTPPDFGFVALANAPGPINVDNIISTDREYMFLHYGGDYRWYETDILLTNYLDADAQDGSVASVTDIFQNIEEVSPGCADSYVIYACHPADGNAYLKAEQGFWIEDFPLNNEAIKVSFSDAYNKVMASNYVKPHSRHCVLRSPIGPLLANPQYIFGNVKAQLYVDAVTGEVLNHNPAFPPDLVITVPSGFPASPAAATVPSGSPAGK